MELAGIPIRLKNTFEPDHPGTLITKDYVGERARVEMVTGSARSRSTTPAWSAPSADLGIAIFCVHDIPTSSRRPTPALAHVLGRTR